MNGRILGFQRRVWWPKWTPASSSCRIEMDGTVQWPPVSVVSAADPRREPGLREASAPPRSERSAWVLRRDLAALPGGLVPWVGPAAGG